MTTSNEHNNAPAVPQGRPFGHFRAEPFGWTDCAATDDGAIALYEHPMTNPWRDAVIEQLESWHIYVPAIHDNSPRLAIKALVNIETKAALDPAVSSEAAALVAGQHNNAPAVPQGYEIHEIPADYSGLVWLEGQVRAVARRAQAATGPQGWTDADSDAARLALELECLLMDTKDLSVVSKWWGSANDALELHRQRLAATPAPAPAVAQGETVAWMVYGNYTRQPFGMLSSAEAYMRGLLKSDPDGGYHIRPLRYATPAPAPAPAQERCSTCGYLTSEREHLGCLRRAVKDLDIATGGPYDAQEVGLTDETQTQDELHSLRLTASGGAYVG